MRRGEVLGICHIVCYIPVLDQNSFSANSYRRELHGRKHDAVDRNLIAPSRRRFWLLSASQSTSTRLPSPWNFNIEFHHEEEDLSNWKGARLAGSSEQLASLRWPWSFVLIVMETEQNLPSTGDGKTDSSFLVPAGVHRQTSIGCIRVPITRFIQTYSYHSYLPYYWESVKSKLTRILKRGPLLFRTASIEDVTVP